MIVDASVAVKFVVEEPDSRIAERYIAGADPLHAPDWLLVEVAHALRRKVAIEELTVEGAHAGFTALPKFFSNLHPATDLIGDGFALAFRLDQAVYDCLYLELAIRRGDRMVTADRKFRNAAVRAGLGDYVTLLGQDP